MNSKLSSNNKASLKRQNSPPNFGPTHRHKLAFTQPSLEPDFFNRVSRDCVCLESIREEPRCLHGIIRVSNLSYSKEVAVRWTHDNWRTSHDTHAVFLSNHGATDRFAFELPINGDDVSFAIRFRSEGTEHWDNNRGSNYTVLSLDDWSPPPHIVCTCPTPVFCCSSDFSVCLLCVNCLYPGFMDHHQPHGNHYHWNCLCSLLIFALLECILYYYILW